MTEFLKWFREHRHEFGVVEGRRIRTPDGQYCPLQVMTRRNNGYRAAAKGMGIDADNVIVAADCVAPWSEDAAILRAQMLRIMQEK